MTRFAEPEVIACPHCQQRYLRKVLKSFNTLWQVRYSDGGTKNAVQNTLINESRCPNCQGIIENIQSLAAVEILSPQPFWKKWFSQPKEYLYLPAPSFDVYFELFEQKSEDNTKLNWAVKALQVFNQTYRLYGQERVTDDYLQQQYNCLVNYILTSYTTHAPVEMILLCADIYRQVGEFQNALYLYNKIDCDKIEKQQFDHIVEPAKRWCENSITSLMAISSQPT